MTTTRVQFLVPEYSAAKKNKKKKKKKKKKCPGPRLPVPGRASSAGMVPSVKMFPNSSTVKLTFQKLGPNVQILFGLGGKWIILPSLVFKTALFTVIILIKSAPSTATQSKIACVFSEGSEKLPSGMVVAKKSKNQKNQKIKKFKKKSKKFKKIQKNYKKTWRPNIRVFACEPGSVLGYLITLLCTALISDQGVIKFQSSD